MELTGLKQGLAFGLAIIADLFGFLGILRILKELFGHSILLVIVDRTMRFGLYSALVLCTGFLIANCMAERHKALQWATSALGYECEWIKADVRDRRRLDIGLKPFYLGSKQKFQRYHIGTFLPLCLVWSLHLLGYSTVTVTVGGRMVLEPIQLQGNDVRLRSIWKLLKFTFLFVKLYIHSVFIRFSKVNFGIKADNGTWYALSDLPEKRLRLQKNQLGLEIKNLLDQGFDTGIRDEEGSTAFETALKFRLVSRLRRFVAAELERTLSKEALVYLAASVGDVRVLDGLLSSLTAQELQMALQYEVESGDTALECAVKHGHLGVLERLLMEVRDPWMVNIALDIASKTRGQNHRITQLLVEKSGLVINREKGTLQVRIAWRGNGRLT